MGGGLLPYVSMAKVQLTVEDVSFLSCNASSLKCPNERPSYHLFLLIHFLCQFFYVSINFILVKCM